jgi:hypothetical protein
MTGGAWVVLIIFFTIYFIPILVAGNRNAAALNGIIILNIFLGWTVIGWFAALIWAYSARPAEPPRTPCPYCAEPILPQASVCPHCRRELVESVIAL